MASSLTGTRVAVELLPHLRRAHDHIDKHYAAPLDLVRLAQVAGVSKYHFARSLGSFSSLFTRLTGETPTAYRDRWAAKGGPHVPGCWLFMRNVLGLPGTAQRSKLGEAQPSNLGEAPLNRRDYGCRMISDISLVTVYCLDQERPATSTSTTSTS